MTKNEKISSIIDDFFKEMDDEGASATVLVRTKENKICNAFLGDDVDVIQLVCVAICTIEEKYGLSIEQIMKFAKASKANLTVEYNSDDLIN